MKNRNDAWERYGLAGLVFAWSAVWILSRRFPDLPPGNDSCFYLVDAKGFATGHPYQDPSSPDRGAGILLGPSFFPWLLSLYWLFVAPHLSLLKLAIALSLASAPAAAFLWLRRVSTTGEAFLIALGFGSAFMFILMGNSIMTECVFIPMLYFAVLLTGDTLPASAGPADNPLGNAQVTRAEIAAALLWVALARTRVVGWFFLAAFLWIAVRRRKWILAFATAGAAGAWVALERVLARGVSVAHYTDNVFSRRYPVQHDVWMGLKKLGENLWVSVFDFATAVCGHLLFPILYELAPMSRGKRAACLLVFAWAAWGAFVTWKNKPTLRPWLVAAALASIPTFVIFQSHDGFRYHLPFFPFLILFLIAPFQGTKKSEDVAQTNSSENHSPEKKTRWPMTIAAVIALSQALGSARHDFDSDYMDYPREFAAIHDSLRAASRPPEICITQDPYYTWLRTGCPSFPNVGLRRAEDFQDVAEGKTAWMICGPGNQFVCDRWQSEGLVFDQTPILRNRFFDVYRIEKWPERKTPKGP